jgi:dimethylamine--corrinoid protein Co-methyltransferase
MRFVSVDRGKEVVLSYDATTLKIRRVGIAVDRIQAVQIYEKILGADSVDFCHVDYSYKAVKPIVGMEQPVLEQALLVSHVPIFYGAMPNLGMYSQPDGPFPNPAELLPEGKIDAARSSYEDAAEAATDDMAFIGSAMYDSGADGINFDTTGAAGDPDFLAALKAIERLKKKYPAIPIELGMAGEFILGMHGELTYEDERLAGMYPHKQVKMAEKAGATIFGPVVNTNSSRSCPWDLARAITFLKACCEVAEIPIHVNMGMGVGAVTMNDHPPIDVVSRASKAMVEICRLDGL